MTRITSIVSTLNETCFMRRVEVIVEEHQRQCVLMQDQTYVKNRCFILKELCLVD